MPTNPNAFNTGGITFIHREPEGAHRLVDIPEIFQPDNGTALGFDVTSRRTLETTTRAGDKRVYMLGMYHAALLNTLFTLGANDDDREKWQPVQDMNDFMGDPANKLVRPSPTALMRAVKALDTLTNDVQSGTEFIEQRMKSKSTSAYRINPSIGFTDIRH